MRRVILVLVVAVSLLMLSFFATRWGFNVANVSAVNSPSYLGVFSDAACNKSVSSVSWGNVSVGSEKDVVVYVKNLGSDPVVLSMNTSGLSAPPLERSAAYLMIYLCWDYGGQPLESGSVVRVTLRLFISSGIAGVSGFSFNINIGSSLAKSPDINGDGVVNTKDLAFLCKAWQTRAGQSSYDYRCDLNNDGIINSKDVAILELYWGVHV